MTQEVDDVPAFLNRLIEVLVDGEQGYDAAATTRFVDTQPYDRLCVEYPQDEAARFPIDLLKAGTVVSLGVVDVAVPEAEDVDALVERIDIEPGTDTDLRELFEEKFVP